MLCIKNNLADKLGKKIIRTPLYYMGGKSKAVRTILSFIPDNIKYLVSPFVGGGSIEVACSGFNFPVVCYDQYFPLICFWASLRHNKKELIEEVLKMKPVTRELYKELLLVIGDGS